MSTESNVPRFGLRDLNTIPAREYDGALSVSDAETFAAVDEPGVGALLGTPEQAVIPVSGDVMMYGDGGAGKTTVAVDLAFHLAAGVPWLGIPVARPARVLLIEAEGPRPLFRSKVERKLAGWTGPSLERRLIVLDEPWATFTFDDEEMRAQLAQLIYARELDLVIAGPLTQIGMTDAGTLQEVRAFASLVGLVRERALRPVASLLVHHENKGGRVSGAWEGVGDTLWHVQGLGHGQTRLHMQKVRWSSDWHRRTLALEWADGEAFAITEKPELDDETVAEMILAAVGESPGSAWSVIKRATKGVGDERRRAVRDGLFAAGRIVNVVNNDGVEVAVRECPERRPSRLYLADDPTIVHLGRCSAPVAPQIRGQLGLVSASVQPQTERPGVEGETGDLGPGAGLIEPQAVEPQLKHPPAGPTDDVDDKSFRTPGRVGIPAIDDNPLLTDEEKAALRKEAREP